MNFKRKVLHGEKLGRKLGFPTLNFHVRNFGDYFEPGVYACTVNLKRSAVSSQRSAKKLSALRSPLSACSGALYFGPKGTGKNVLEIHVLNFSEQIYGQFVSFEVGEKIRGPKKFDSLEALKEGIAEDLERVRGLPQPLRRRGAKFR